MVEFIVPVTGIGSGACGIETEICRLRRVLPFSIRPSAVRE
jgi:hypothetical protein